MEHMGRIDVKLEDFNYPIIDAKNGKLLNNYLP